MNGHVFVVPGTLDSLHCDDVVVSTDGRGAAGVRPNWWPTLGWDHERGRDERRAAGHLTEDRRFLPLDPRGRPGGGPARWLLHVGAWAGGDVAWIGEGIRQVLRAIADSGAHPIGRPRRVALPVMGVGGGGHGAQRGAVIRALLQEVAKFSDTLDVVIVANSRSDYSALQAQRRSLGRSILGDESLEAAAQDLAGHARSGELAVFMGAGTGVSAGLPTWSGLLQQVAQRLPVPGGAAALSRLSPLDAAEVLRRVADAPATSGGRDPEGKTLGELVVDVLGRPSRYALSHVLLAALGAEQVITTNFDDLYEKAVEAITGRKIPVVLPDTDPDSSLRRGRGWLLKLHGDAARPASIVLDRRSFVRYDATQRPLASVLQATLLTKHLLVVGASMTDDNVVRLVHEVASLNEQHARRQTMGTLVTLEDEPLTAQLWDPELTTVAVGPAAPLDESEADRAVRLTALGRQLEIFLDRVAMLASRDSAHLLDQRYADLLDERERALAQRLADAANAIRHLGGTTSRAGEWDEVLIQLERWGARKR